GEDQAGAAHADAIDEEASGQERLDGGHAVHGVHGPDGGAVGVEHLNEGGLDGADAIVSEVDAEGHQGREGQDDEAVGYGGRVESAVFRWGHGSGSIAWRWKPEVRRQKLAQPPAAPD